MRLLARQDAGRAGDPGAYVRRLRRRGRAAVVQAAVALEESGVATYCTAVAWAEIYAGVGPREEAPTRAFFEARGDVVLDGRVGRQAGGYLARYARSHGVELSDDGPAVLRARLNPTGTGQRATGDAFP